MVIKDMSACHNLPLWLFWYHIRQGIPDSLPPTSDYCSNTGKDEKHRTCTKEECHIESLFNTEINQRKAEIGPLEPTTVSRVGKEWKDKIHRRCSDLLVVDNCEHPVLMKEPVDFLHRYLFVDAVNTSLMTKSWTVRNHWTHARDPTAPQGTTGEIHGGIFKANGGLPSKSGRPLLDYALHPRRVTQIQVLYHSQRDEPNMDRSMWVNRREATPVSIKEWLEVGKLLIDSRTTSDRFSSADLSCLGSMEDVLVTIFGESQASILLRLMESRQPEAQGSYLIQ
ncbi:Flavin oxidoreductase hxnT [Fusarium oxysporum f. sp. albedinis]|nr:Flavin oxidoreductase hxnT [Fusarium oxysporum f. sp. albedinis]